MTGKTQTGGRLTEQLGRFALVGVLAILVVGFSLLRPESFGTFDNFKAIGDNYATVLLLAFAATLPLIVGEFDLSIASTFTFVQVIVVGLVLQSGWSVWAAIAVALVAATIVGIVNGIAISRFGISSFIATLASGSILSGVTLAYSNGEAIFGKAPKSLTNLARSEFLGLRLPILYGIALAIIIGVALARLPVGRRMYATGSNQRAAQLTGIPTQRYVIGTFVLSSWLAAIAGVVLGARIGAATPDTGTTLLIPAFAGAFLGATAFTPGRFNVPGTFIAVYVVGVAVTGLQQMGAALWVEPVFNGLVLFIAVGLSAWTTRLRAARARKARLRELEEHRDQVVERSPPAAGVATPAP
jgi:ribose transport system permease protein